MKKTWEYVNDILKHFRPCFSREAAFQWFLVVVIGLMTRTDHLGVSSIIRELSLDPHKYNSLIHFFRSEAWRLELIQQKWIEIIKESGVIHRIYGQIVLIGDGVKQGHEASRMPGVKKLHQESEDSSKSEYIRGHLFGGLGILIGDAAKLFCLPVSMRLHDGNGAILEWKESEYKNDSHVTRLVREASNTAFALGERCFLLLDAYFLTGPALEAIEQEASKAGKDLVSLITRAKSNYTAWWKQDSPNAAALDKNGNPRPKDSFRIMDLFRTQAQFFSEDTLMLYGELTKVRYLCVDLIWGRNLYREIRFVLTELDGSPWILACTDLEVDPRRIIELYCYRFKIEALFRAFKQVLAGFSCHFWSRRMPVFKMYIKAKEMEAKVEAVKADISKASIINTYDAIEGFVMFACIAMGLIQICALRFYKEINNSKLRWMRTNSSTIPSEDTTAFNMRISLPSILNKFHDLAFVKAIRDRQPGVNDVSVDAFDSSESA